MLDHKRINCLRHLCNDLDCIPDVVKTFNYVSKRMTPETENWFQFLARECRASLVFTSTAFAEEGAAIRGERVVAQFRKMQKPAVVHGTSTQHPTNQTRRISDL